MKRKINPAIIKRKKKYYTILFFIFFSLTSLFAFAQCGVGEFPPIKFRSNSPLLLNSAITTLKTVADRLKANPFCSILVTISTPPSKSQQYLGQKRLDQIKSYLFEKGAISPDRITINWEVSGGSDPNIAEIRENK